ncbi:DUF2840 domain-containing protein [Bradyrhizobium ontarionense]|uniref:DUF2840 domain-containing protein n=1 Tax=Bradyrhizobium ontarionense TaxID=2898149 RepID=A0ABY3R6I8_9BRAD|nr:DUF2840 domain-containing protein [Bradyrhizobium sp. A19]UFZ02624.1 DUF2840 domain-containing protein [Bradyrhizobium sp. A19]
MSELTRVQLLWLQGKIENRIRFGRTVQELRLDHYRREFSFIPGSVFAFVHWSSNDYGTVLSRIDILQAVRAGEACATVPFVDPGAAILLQAFGWPKVERVLQHIDAIEALGIDPVDVAPDHWRHVQNRLASNEPPRPYTPLRNRAWLHRRSVMP